jgi:hypothetical protein
MDLESHRIKKIDGKKQGDMRGQRWNERVLKAVVTLVVESTVSSHGHQHLPHVHR